VGPPAERFHLRRRAARASLAGMGAGAGRVGHGEGGTAALAGWLLAAMLGLTIARQWWPSLPAALPGLAAWLAAALLWPRLPGGQRLQALLLGGLGLAALGVAVLRGAHPRYADLLAQNLPILAMLAGVSFLRSAGAGLSGDGGAAPRGPGAYLRTLLGLHAFGAVINLSALVIIADRLAGASDRPGAAATGQRRGPAPRTLDPRAALLLSRGFSCAAFYSPFFGGVALALASTPGSSLAAVAAVGGPAAALALAYAALEARLRDPLRLRDFAGYPLRYESLWLPGALAAGVAVSHWLAPERSVLGVITVLAPATTALLLLGRHGPGRGTRALERHVTGQLPGMSGELALFLAAGVLAVGLRALVGVLAPELPFERFDVTAAGLLLAGIVLLAVIGVHPVVPVAVATPLLAPLAPSPNLLAATYTLAWGIGVSVSPFSGTHLTLQGRYGVDALAFPRRNAGFALALSAAAWGLLHLLPA